MHAAGKKLTMAVATWNPIWNLQLLGQTDVDKIMYVLSRIFAYLKIQNKAGKIDLVFLVLRSFFSSIQYYSLQSSRGNFFRTMSTYTSNFTTFHTKLNQAASLVPIHKLGIGLQDDTNPRISDLEAKLRVQMIQDLGIQEIDIWQAPIPDGWMLPLRRFAANAWSWKLNIPPILSSSCGLKKRASSGYLGREIRPNAHPFFYRQSLVERPSLLRWEPNPVFIV